MATRLGFRPGARLFLVVLFFSTRHGRARLAHCATATLQGGDAQRWRTAFEAATRALASHTVLRDVHKDYEDRCLAKEKTAGDLRRQIEGLRAQLQRYGEALENELAGGRETVAHRVREALSFEKIFTDSSSLLMGQLQGRPEVSELFDEMKRDEAAHSLQVASSGSIRADQTGSFKTIS